jgi:hypothetical protein
MHKLTSSDIELTTPNSVFEIPADGVTIENVSDLENSNGGKSTRVVRKFHTAVENWNFVETLAFCAAFFYVQVSGTHCYFELHSIPSFCYFDTGIHFVRCWKCVFVPIVDETLNRGELSSIS